MITATQQLILDLLADATHAQIRSTGGRGNMRTVRNLAKAGLLRYRASGAWIAISRPDCQPEIPGGHILHNNLTIIIDALKAHGPMRDHWQLFDHVRGTMAFQSMIDALRYGHRCKLLRAPAAHNGFYSDDHSITLL